jgi:hypothetical protein
MKYDIEHEEALLRGPGKLSTHPHIFCVKCEGKTTAFGSNLKGKIEKAGSLGALLSTFECRSCRTSGQTNKRLPKALRKKRGSKGAAKHARTQDLLRNLPSMVFSERKPIVLLDNPGFAGEVTATSCVRPDIFLDSDRSCDFCALYQICKAPNRSLSKQGWQLGVAA